jgi:hypothetical protein
MLSNNLTLGFFRFFRAYVVFLQRNMCIGSGGIIPLRVESKSFDLREIPTSTYELNFLI